MTKGSIVYSGNSDYSSYRNDSGGSSSTTSGQSTVDESGKKWSGSYTNSNGNTLSISYPPYESGWTAISYFTGLQSTTPTQQTYSQTSDDYQSQGTNTLSDEFTTDAFVADAISNVGDYPEEWTKDYWSWGNYWGYDGLWYYCGYGYPWYGWVAASRSLSKNEESFSLSKIKYKFEANPSAPMSLKWYEMFVPYDDPNTSENESSQVQIIRERTWQRSGQAKESAEFELDPSTEEFGNGYYTIMMNPIYIGVDGVGEGGKNISGKDASPGKVVLINDGDADNDGIPDYADGYDFNSQVEDDNSLSGTSFTPVYLGICAIDPQRAKIRFTYDASDPKAITWTSTDPYQLPPNGKMRLWTKDVWGGGYRRNPDSVKDGGDFIQSGVAYTFEELGISDYESWYYDYTLYAELVKISEAVADIPIKVEIDPTGDMGFVFSDQLRFTGVKIETLARGLDETTFTPGIPFVASNLKDFDARVQAYGSTPGAFSIYRVRVYDPRASLDNIRVASTSIPLERKSSFWETPDFLCLTPNSPVDFSEAPSLNVIASGSKISLDYNPAIIEKFLVTKKVPKVVQEAYAAVDKAQQTLKAEGWTPPAGTTNPGVFGNEVHQWVSEYFAPSGLPPKKGWVANLFIHNDTGVVLSIGEIPPGGVKGSTQIDLMAVKGNYRPVVNRPLDQRQILHVFDIKTSDRISAEEIGNFVDRIRAVTGKEELYLPQVKERWSLPKGGWFVNKTALRHRKLAQWCSALTVVTSIAALPEGEAKADECIQKAVAYRTALRTGSGDIDTAKLEFAISMREFLAIYSISPIQDGVQNLALMKWLLSEDAASFDHDPEYDN